VLSQLAIFCGSILVAGVIHLTAGRHDEFVDEWATEALNLQFVSVFIVVLLTVAVLLDSGVMFTIVVLVAMVWSLYAVVVSIIGSVKAWDCQRWRYPINLRLFR
jgi:uncharacterized Tic20 family protein